MHTEKKNISFDSTTTLFSFLHSSAFSAQQRLAFLRHTKMVLETFRFWTEMESTQFHLKFVWSRQKPGRAAIADIFLCVRKVCAQSALTLAYTLRYTVIVYNCTLYTAQYAVWYHFRFDCQNGIRHSEVSFLCTHCRIMVYCLRTFLVTDDTIKK